LIDTSPSVMAARYNSEVITGKEMTGNPPVIALPGLQLNENAALYMDEGKVCKEFRVK